MKSLINFLLNLKIRIREQQARREQQMKKCLDFRSLITGMEEEVILKRQEVSSLRAELQVERSKSQAFENRIINAESANSSLQRHLQEYQKYAKYSFH